MNEKRKALAIVQARMGSSRLPGKSMAMLNGKPTIWHLFNQMKGCKTVLSTILATTEKTLDDPLASYAEEQGWPVYRGSEEDVLGRYHDTAVEFGANDDTPIVRLTGDDIFTDPLIINGIVNFYFSMLGQIDVVCTDDRDNQFPYGGGASLFSFRALKQAHEEATEAFDREHVSPYIYRNHVLFPSLTVSNSNRIDILQLSIDNPEDFTRAESLLKELEQTSKAPYKLSEVINAAQTLNFNNKADKNLSIKNT
jgi:spore coat polysaccharide biosynthesis protein SpsF